MFKVKHIVDDSKCIGDGKCVEVCGLELWELVDIGRGVKKARPKPEAAEICHCCRSCEGNCPAKAITLTCEE